MEQHPPGNQALCENLNPGIGNDGKMLKFELLAHRFLMDGSMKGAHKFGCEA